MNAINLQRRRDVKEGKQKMTGSGDCCKGEDVNEENIHFETNWVRTCTLGGVLRSCLFLNDTFD